MTHAQTILTISGMHCASCVALVQMALEEENELNQLLKEVRLTDADHQTGIAVFTELTPAQHALAVKTIKSAGHYQVMEN